MTNEKQMTFSEIEPSFSDSRIIITRDLILAIRDNSSRELLRITRDGEVIAPSLEAASEAGRLFAQALRENLSKNS